MKKVLGKFLLQHQSSRSGQMLVVALMAMTLPISTSWAAAPSDASGYEISLGELHKVKKERPVKKEIKERKRKKSESAGHRPALGAIVPPGAVITTPADVSGEAGRVVSPEPAQPAVSAATITIHHDPYSFVIKGKRTIIQAVISSVDNIQSVYCRFRAAESASYAVIPMLQAQGTLFTYVATLPALDAASRTLRYSVVAVDASGVEARSQEFVITVKPSTVLPGWQLETSAEQIKIKREDKAKPLEGFADPGIIE